MSRELTDVVPSPRGLAVPFPADAARRRRPRLAVVVPEPTATQAAEGEPSGVGPALGLAAVLKGCGFIGGMLVAKVSLDPSLGSSVPPIALAYAVGGAAIGILCAMALVLVLDRRAMVRSIVWTLAAALVLMALLIFVPRPVAHAGGTSADEPAEMHLQV